MIRDTLGTFTKASALLGVCLAIGCSQARPIDFPAPAPYTPPPPEAFTPVNAEFAPSAASTTKTSDQTDVYVDGGIARACGIPDPKSHFAYDSADVRQEDVSTLQGIASCFREGPLKGKTVEIIGRTDQRGSLDYNQQLGKSRAEAVGELLSEKGVSKGKIVTRSTGEARAKGIDEQTMANDRRVDIRLRK